MPTVQELREKRANIWAQAQDFDRRDKAGDTMSAEDEAAWSRALAEVDALAAQIENRETTAELDKRYAEIDENTDVVNPGGERDAGARGAYRAAFEKFCRNGMADLDADERALLQTNHDPNNLRAQGASTGAAGGYTVPEGFWAKVTETKKFFGGMLAGVAEEIPTDSGNDLPWPTNDDTSNEGEILGENTAVTEQDIDFGQKTLGAFIFSSKMVKVSLPLLQDTGIDLESLLARRLGERIGRRQNRAFTTGTGASQPQGFVTGATVGKTTAGATAITYDEIVDLVHSVDAAYRNERCRFQLHDLILAHVRKIRDDSGGAGLGRPIWEPSVQVGVPDSLLGYRVGINNDMDSTVATAKKTIGFGDFMAHYALRRVSGGQLMRLSERYADALQVAFIGFERADGLVQDTSAVKVLKQA